MNELLTPSQMALADQLTIDRIGSSYTLMELAGQAAARVIESILTDPVSVTIFVGTGNNGGDGYVIAEQLRRKDYPIRVVEVSAAITRSGDASLAKNDFHGVVEPFDSKKPLSDTVIIDCLLGAGLSRDVTGEYSDAISCINNSGMTVIAIDLPSGIDGASGAVKGRSVQANHTITFFRKKPGHLLQPGRFRCGDIAVVDIGIGAEVLDTIRPSAFENDTSHWINAFPVPGADGHKFHRGHLLVVSGPITRAGAARLSAYAALRAGAGLVTLAATSDALVAHAAHVTAIMLADCRSENDLKDLLDDPRISSVVIGPGLGRSDAERALVEAVLKTDRDCVLDADALSVFEGHAPRLFNQIENRTGSVVLTPHEGEFGRLFPELKSHANKLEKTQLAANSSGAVIVLKGSDTIIAEPNGRAVINSNAPAWLATAGSGDVLTGVIGGLLAQGVDPFKAASIGVWLHGDAGHRAGPALTAEDLDRALQTSIKDVVERISD